MKTNKFSITIGIIVYNREKQIIDCIKSALNQTINIDEILIINDGSNDKTLQNIRGFKNSNIILITNKINKGIPYSRNKIISEAKGDLIFFFDSDDISLENRVQVQYDILTNNNTKIANNIFCYTSRLIVKSGRKKYTLLGISPDELLSSKLSSKVSYYLLGVFFHKKLFGSTATCTLAASKKRLISLNGFDENFSRSEDTEIAVRHSLNGGLFTSSSKNLVIQNITKKSYNVHLIELKYHISLIQKYSNILSYKQIVFATNWEFFKTVFFSKNFILSLYLFCFLFFMSPILVIRKVINGLSFFSSTKHINRTS